MQFTISTLHTALIKLKSLQVVYFPMAQFRLFTCNMYLINAILQFTTSSFLGNDVQKENRAYNICCTQFQMKLCIFIDFCGITISNGNLMQFLQYFSFMEFIVFWNGSLDLGVCRKNSVSHSWMQIFPGKQHKKENNENLVFKQNNHLSLTWIRRKKNRRTKHLYIVEVVVKMYD